MNKPVIVDGVDVAECKYVDIEERKNYTDLIVCVACKEDITDGKECENNPNCYYKQLQRLKEGNEKLLDIITEGKAENKRIIKECRNLEKENIALKQALEDISKIVKEILLTIN